MTFGNDDCGLRRGVRELAEFAGLLEKAPAESRSLIDAFIDAIRKAGYLRNRQVENALPGALGATEPLVAWALRRTGLERRPLSLES